MQKILDEYREMRRKQFGGKETLLSNWQKQRPKAKAYDRDQAIRDFDAAYNRA